MKKLFILVLSLVLVISMMPIGAVATEGVVPYAYPTISSTVCTRCGGTMVKISTSYEYPVRTIQSILCPNSPYADESSYHTHMYRQQYDNYECSTCGSWGRMFVESIMYRCSLTAGDKKGL